MDRPRGHRRKLQPTPCHMLTRLNYFTGHLLSAEDFTAEQDYVREKLRRHNRTLHHPGVVDGLEVTVESAGVQVAPGFALDAIGNEICVPLAQGAPLPSIMGEVYVVLRYKEVGVNPIPVLGTPGEGNADCVPTRIQESFEICYDPPGGDLTPTPPQNPSPPVRLARLRFTQGRWRVDGRFRRPKAR